MNRCAEHPRGDPCLLLPEWAQAQIATLQSQLAGRYSYLSPVSLSMKLRSIFCSIILGALQS
jgi:hypothetical protein